MNRTIKIALAGNPNCGKTSLFNALTGLNQQVGNYPGITVDKKTGKFKINNQNYLLIDVPGTYSTHPKSTDEQVALETVNDKTNKDFPDLLIYVADSTNLKKGLLLFSQLYDKKIPIIFALNMTDLSKKAGIVINLDELSKQLNVPVIEINARKEQGINELKTGIENYQKYTDEREFKPFVANKELDYKLELQERYFKINKVLNSSVTLTNDFPTALSWIDRVVTHKIFGYLTFAFIMLIIFQTVFSLAEYPMEWIEYLFLYVGDVVSANLPNGVLKDLLVDGILAGLSGVVVFIPQITLLFFFIGVLEDSGYMSRVSFLLDKILRKFGLHGKSVIPLMSGMACAIPAIMSARTISNTKERLITILVTPFITCAARLPVYVLIISIIIPNEFFYGVINYQGLALMILYVLGFVVALFAAWVLKIVLKTKERSYFILEMPTYKMPRWKNIGFTVFEKVRVFVFDAGKIIVAISVILWLLSSNSPGNKFEKLDNEFNAGKIDEVELNSKKLEASYVGILGKAIEPLIKPMGFDWKIGISLITSFAAREVFVGSMATIYSVGNVEDTLSIREKMMQAKDPETGNKIYTFAVGVSLLVFYAFALQCMSTIAVVYRETKSIKWPIFQLVSMTGLAYVLATLCYQILK